MSCFTDNLYMDTKNAHTQVDKHPFVSLIRTNKIAGTLYINFNKICIHEIQNSSHNIPEDLYKKLYRQIDLDDIYISPTLLEIIQHCRSYPLESAYQFYLGLLFGGNMLKRMLPEYTEFLTYENNKQLISDFKNYLNNNITNQDQFIQRVNECYTLIKLLFDEYHVKIENETNLISKS